MTKQHFVALAETVQHLNTNLELWAWRIPKTPEHEEMLVVNLARTKHLLIRALADFCQSQNSRFDRERWLDYIAGKNGSSGSQK